MICIDEFDLPDRNVHPVDGDVRGGKEVLKSFGNDEGFAGLHGSRWFGWFSRHQGGEVDRPIFPPDNVRGDTLDIDGPHAALAECRPQQPFPRAHAFQLEDQFPRVVV